MRHASPAHCAGVCILLYLHAKLAGAAAGHLGGNESGWHAAEGSSAGQHSRDCAEPLVDRLCECEYLEGGLFGSYLCSTCKDPLKWGVGCDTNCSPACRDGGCDFAGNCHPVPENCKRNARSGGDNKDQIYNERGECVACKDGWHGLHCDAECPVNCARTTEGSCTRAGKCYRCKEGWYGPDCAKECPFACRKKCVMLDGTVPMKNWAGKGASVQFFPAGSCAEQCKENKFGDRCETDCPANCDSRYTPSCTKTNGDCIACQGGKFFGNKCIEPCSAGCQQGKCNKADGACLAGCVAGFFGKNCEKACPEGTTNKGCDRTSGLPYECKESLFPGLLETDPPLGACLTCPARCKGGTCINGVCDQGCHEGYHGKQCDVPCPSTCKGPCDSKTTGERDGNCKKCAPGFSGKACQAPCHASCQECEQSDKSSCLSCQGDQPTFLQGGECACIKGASPAGPAGACACDSPPTDSKEAFFVSTPEKECRAICKKGFQEVFGTLESICLSNDVYAAVVRQEIAGLNRDGCAGNEYSITLPEPEGPMCLREDFVDDILDEGDDA